MTHLSHHGFAAPARGTTPRAVTAPIIAQLAAQAAEAANATSSHADAIRLTTRTAFALIEPRGVFKRWTLLGFTAKGQAVEMGRFWTRHAAARAAAAMSDRG